MFPCAKCSHNLTLLTGTNRHIINKILNRSITNEDVTRIKEFLKKKRKKNKKKFAELVEVNDTRSMVRKATVRKFTANHMAQLTKEPNITLENLGDLRISPPQPKKPPPGRTSDLIHRNMENVDMFSHNYRRLSDAKEETAEDLANNFDNSKWITSGVGLRGILDNTYNNFLQREQAKELAELTLGLETVDDLIKNMDNVNVFNDPQLSDAGKKIADNVANNLDNGKWNSPNVVLRRQQVKELTELTYEFPDSLTRKLMKNVGVVENKAAKEDTVSNTANNIKDKIYQDKSPTPRAEVHKSTSKVADNLTQRNTKIQTASRTMENKITDSLNSQNTENADVFPDKRSIDVTKKVTQDMVNESDSLKDSLSKNNSLHPQVEKLPRSAKEEKVSNTANSIKDNIYQDKSPTPRAEVHKSTSKLTDNLTQRNTKIQTKEDTVSNTANSIKNKIYQDKSPTPRAEVHKSTSKVADNLTQRNTKIQTASRTTENKITDSLNSQNTENADVFPDKRSIDVTKKVTQDMANESDSSKDSLSKNNSLHPQVEKLPRSAKEEKVSNTANSIKDKIYQDKSPTPRAKVHKSTSKLTDNLTQRNTKIQTKEDTVSNTANNIKDNIYQNKSPTPRVEVHKSTSKLTDNLTQRDTKIQTASRTTENITDSLTSQNTENADVFPDKRSVDVTKMVTQDTLNESDSAKDSLSKNNSLHPQVEKLPRSVSKLLGKLTRHAKKKTTVLSDTPNVLDNTKSPVRNLLMSQLADITSEITDNLNLQSTEQAVVLKSDNQMLNISDKKKKKRTKKESDIKLEAIKTENIRKGKQEKFNNSLASYIDVCVFCDFLNRGFGTLHHYSHKNHNKNNIKITSAVPFNTLMHGFATKANIGRVKDLLRLMNNNDVKFTHQTFAACFDCLGRLPESPELSTELKAVHNLLKSYDYTFQSIFDTCTFCADQRSTILKAIRLIEPNFIPATNPPILEYACSLVNKLNEENNSYNCPVSGLLTEENMKELVQEQLKMEVNVSHKVKSVVQPAKVSAELLKNRKQWDDLQDAWRMTIREAFARDLQAMRSFQNDTNSCHKMNVYPYLKTLTAEQFVDIVLNEIRKLVEGSETYSPSLHSLYRTFGNQVQLRYHVKSKMNNGVLPKIEKLYKKYCQWYLNPSVRSESKNTREQWQRLQYESNSEGPSLDGVEKTWPSNVVEEIGELFYNMIIKDIKIDVNMFRSTNTAPNFLPAFYTLFRFHGEHFKEEIKPHPVLLRLYRSTAAEFLHFDVNILPMVSPPLPWTSLNSGGYPIVKADLVRLSPDSVGHSTEKVFEETPVQKLYPSFDSLNQLAAVPWKVNQKVLDLVLQVFRSGGSTKLDIPLSPNSFSVNTITTSDNKFNHYKERLTFWKKKAEMYGLWCETLYRLSLANHFRDRIFWLPHNMDFRGRVYPLPPHLNHLGADMARSLLWFAKGEKLGRDGLNWLKIHCINLTGLKKRNSIADRLVYANEKLPDILDSAEKPFTGRMWWAHSDEPWQTLACCLEIKSVLDSGDAENFVSHFPVHQDGSCNGLQHYAALGRDEIGAESVNLKPSRIPQDVYSCVVAMVENERRKDAENGVEVAQQLEGFIKRKVIKQTVMTTVYGVTKYGARLQIAKQLKDIDDFPEHLVWSGSLYLVTKTFYCLQEMFTSTKDIQDWFIDCAKYISQFCGKCISWETPLGFPVEQPYMKTMKSKAAGSDPKTMMSVNINVKPNSMKQKNAFPPNFIHSLDSSHMMLTSLFCERKGITFVSVHDCYWTHPCSVNIMNKICREEFVALHSEPILENLSSYLWNKFGTGSPVNVGSTPFVATPQILLNVPRKGNFKLEEVLNSQYFFS